MLTIGSRVVTYDDMEWGTIEARHEGTHTVPTLFDVRLDTGRVLQFDETRLATRHPFGESDPRIADDAERAMAESDAKWRRRDIANQCGPVGARTVPFDTGVDHGPEPALTPREAQLVRERGMSADDARHHTPAAIRNVHYVNGDGWGSRAGAGIPD